MGLAKLNIPIPSGGLEIDKPAEFIDQRSISNVQNIEIYRNLVQQRRGGTALGASLGERILGMGELESGSTTYFVRIGLTLAQVIDKSALTWSSIANSALTATQAAQVYFAFPLLSGARIMVYTNGVDAVRKFTGSGNDANLGGSPPVCKFLVDFGGYLVLAYTTTNFARVQWSDAGDPENWSTGDAGSTNLLEDSLAITGILRYGQYLTVHKESAIYLGQLVNTSEVFRFTRKETGAGAISQGSIQNLPDGTQIFLARDGFRLFNGSSSTLIPSSIVEELRDSMNPEWVQRATSVVVKDLDEYWCGIPIGNATEPETVYKYNYRTGKVWKDNRSGLMVMALYRRTNQESWDSDSDTWDSDTTTWDTVSDLSLHKQVAFGDDTGLATLRSSNVDDVSTAIDSIWDTKDFNASDVSEESSLGTLVRWSSLDVWAKGNAVSIYYSTDSGSTWNFIDTISLDSDYPTDAAPDIVYFDVTSSKIRFRFRNATAEESWTLKQYTIGFSLREARK